MITSPFLGKLGDRYGASRILMFSLVGAGLAFIPQAFVQNIWQLLVIRFFLGVCIGGLLPSVNSLIRLYTPNGMESRAYSFNTSFLSLGNMAGPLLGGVLSGWIGIRGIFIMGSFLLFVNALWFRKIRADSKPKPLSSS
jgi:DHA1 family multidrug resistance protein-like MFS transporter